MWQLANNVFHTYLEFFPPTVSLTLSHRQQPNCVEAEYGTERILESLWNQSNTRLRFARKTAYISVSEIILNPSNVYAHIYVTTTRNRCKDWANGLAILSLTLGVDFHVKCMHMASI